MRRAPTRNPANRAELKVTATTALYLHSVCVLAAFVLIGAILVGLF
jgi:hypothetical protein